MSEWDDPPPHRESPVTGGAPRRIGSLGRQRPAGTFDLARIALALTRRIAIELNPTSGRRFNPSSDGLEIDLQLERGVRETAEGLGIRVDSIVDLSIGDWRRVCFALAQRVNPDSDRYPEWPEGWREMWRKAKGR